VADPWSKRQGSEPKVYQHGATKMSDEKVEERIISIQGVFNVSMINTTYGVALRDNLKEMKQQCYTEDLRLYFDTAYSDEYYNVECLSFEHTFLQTITIVEIFIDFICSDPFRYYKDETTDTKNPVVSGTPYALTSDNDGDIEVSPVISYTAGGTQTNVKIENAGDAAKYFEYAGGLVNTDVLEVDCLEGTVEKNGSDDIADFTGSFFNLVSGTNTINITITGTAGTSICVMTFRKRYL